MHMPGHTRDTFVSWIESVVAGEANITDEIAETTRNEALPVNLILGRLWNCTDVLPRAIYAELELTGRRTYAVAVRTVASRRKSTM